MSTTHRRVPFDSAANVERVRSTGCFVCRIAASDVGEYVVWRDADHVAFLPRFHVQLGYVLVAPVEHREAVAGDFSGDEYLALQALVHRVATALSTLVPTERIYVASLGSRQGNAHVHWHVVALPPGVPFEEQQFRAMMPEANGVLDLSENERVDLAERLRGALSC